MIKLDGVTLRVKKIRQSRNGDFCVADLSSEIGEFKVKDPLLDQFEDGEYTGTVWLSEIYLAQYISWGKGVTEIRARLHDLQIDGMDELSAQLEPAEPDPVDEFRAPEPEPATQPEPDAPSSIEKLKQKLAGIGRKAKPAANQRLDDDELEQLFDVLWPAVQAREPVKLDATVDRIKLRKQIATLKEKFGYALDPRSQTWNPHQ